MDLYADIILDHYKSPRGKVAIANPHVTHHELNVSCGDTLTLSLRIEDGVIREIGWEGDGCAISQAGMSMLAEELVGMSVADAAAFDAAHMLTLLGVPIGPRRMKCALLGLHALKNGLRALEGKEPQPWRETMGGEE